MAQGVTGRLRPRIILTFRHYKDGRSSAIHTSHLYPRRNPWYSLSEAKSTSVHIVLPGVPRKKSPVTPPGIDPGTVRLVAQRLNHYATSGPNVGPELLFPNEEHVQCDHRFASQPLANEPLHSSQLFDTSLQKARGTTSLCGP